MSHIIKTHAVKTLLHTLTSSRIITIHGDCGEPLLEATSVRKVCSSQFISKGRHPEMLVSRSLQVEVW